MPGKWSGGTISATSTALQLWPSSASANAVIWQVEATAFVVRRARNETVIDEPSVVWQSIARFSISKGQATATQTSTTCDGLVPSTTTAMSTSSPSTIALGHMTTAEIIIRGATRVVAWAIAILAALVLLTNRVVIERLQPKPTIECRLPKCFRKKNYPACLEFAVY